MQAGALRIMSVSLRPNIDRNMAKHQRWGSTKRMCGQVWGRKKGSDKPNNSLEVIKLLNEKDNLSFILLLTDLLEWRLFMQKGQGKKNDWRN